MSGCVTRVAYRAISEDPASTTYMDIRMLFANYCDKTGMYILTEKLTIWWGFIKYDTESYSKKKFFWRTTVHTGKPPARPGRKQANVSVKMAWISFGTFLARRGKQQQQQKKLNEGSRLDVVEIARVPDILPSLFPSWSG